MLILNSAWPFSPVRSTSSRRCTRVPESATTLTNSAFYVSMVGPAASVLVRINTVFSAAVCVSLAHVRPLQPRGGYRSPKGGT